MGRGAVGARSVSTAGRVAAAVAAAVASTTPRLGTAARLDSVAAAAAARAALVAALLAVESLEQPTEDRTLHVLLAGSSGAPRVGTAISSTTSRFRTAVASRTAGLSTAAVASRTSGLATIPTEAAVAGVAGGLSTAAAGAGAARVLPLAAVEQPLQPTEQRVLLAALRSGGATTVRAAVASVASRFRTAVAGRTSGLSTTATEAAVAGRTSGLTGIGTAVASATAGLRARRATLLAAEHPVKDLETEGLATDRDAEDQRTEEQHTLHRAITPLLVDHARGLRSRSRG